MTDPLKLQAQGKSRRAFFNRLAYEWDQQLCFSCLNNFLEKLLPTFEIKKGQIILDIGTGTGILVPHLLLATGVSGIVVAVDFAEEMMKVCSEKFSGISNVMVGLQTVENLGFLEKSFDTVTCFGLFPHIEDKEKAVNELNRVLKLGGKLIIAHALSCNEIKAHHHNAASVVAHDELPNKEKMKSLLSKVGFKVDLIKDEPGCYVCKATKTATLQIRGDGTRKDLP